MPCAIAGAGKWPSCGLWSGCSEARTERGARDKLKLPSISCPCRGLTLTWGDCWHECNRTSEDKRVSRCGGPTVGKEVAQVDISRADLL